MRGRKLQQAIENVQLHVPLWSESLLVVGYLEALEEEVATALRERDEARAEVERLRARYEVGQ